MIHFRYKVINCFIFQFVIDSHIFDDYYNRSRKFDFDVCIWRAIGAINVNVQVWYWLSDFDHVNAIILVLFQRQSVSQITLNSDLSTWSKLRIFENSSKKDVRFFNIMITLTSLPYKTTLIYENRGQEIWNGFKINLWLKNLDEKNVIIYDRVVLMQFFFSNIRILAYITVVYVKFQSCRCLIVNCFQWNICIYQYIQM